MMASWWPHIVPFGESAWLVPVALAIGVVLWLAASRARALLWLLTFGAAFLLVVAAKLAFDVGGWRLPALGLYSISGHAMLAGAVYPMLLMLVGRTVSARWSRWGVLAGAALALVMAIALVAGDYHTPIETVIGGAIGFGVAWLNVRRGAGSEPRRLGMVLALMLLAVCLAVPAGLHARVRPVKHALLHGTMQWLGKSGYYKRYIETDPQTGHKRIRIVTIGS